MFRYHYINAHGKRIDGSHEIAVGDVVQCRYRAPWIGRVEYLARDGGIAFVRQLRDRHGNPFRKPRTISYHCHWFKVVPRDAKKPER